MKKKILIGVLVVVLLVVGALGVTLAVTFGPLKPIPEGATFGPATVLVDAGFVSLYLVDAGDGKFVLVDGGTQQDGAGVKAALAERGATADDLLAIVLTHGHNDHVSAAYAFPDVPMYAHEADVPLVEGQRGPNGAVNSLAGPNAAGLKVDHIMKDGDVLEFGTARFRVFHTPGHTPGNCALLVNDTLLLGDTAGVTKDDTVRPPPSFFSDDPEQAIAAVRKLATEVQALEAKPKRMIGSHTGGTERIEALFAYPEE